MKFTHSLLFILICLCLTFSHAANAAPARQAGFDQYNPPDLLKNSKFFAAASEKTRVMSPPSTSIGIIYARAGKLKMQSGSGGTG